MDTKVGDRDLLFGGGAPQSPPWPRHPRPSSRARWRSCHRAVTKVNAVVAPKVSRPGGRARIRRVKAA